MKEETKKKILPFAKLGARVAGDIVARKVYNTIFSRYERPDYSITPGLVKFDFYNSLLAREEIPIKSKFATLQAYFYKNEASKKLIVLAHGFHAGSDDLLPITYFFVKNGFNVFTYDVTGTYESGGNGTRGFPQWLVDIDYALNFVQKDKRFKKMDLYLLGHSCGGFAVTAVLSFKKGIKAVASISAPNDAYRLITEKGSQYAGEFANQGIPKSFLDTYQKGLFGKYIDYTAVDGVNKSNIPVLIAHGLEDEVIDYDLQSLISHRDEISNPNVTYYFGTGSKSKHTSILFSDGANEIQEEVARQYKEIQKEHKKDKDKIYEERVKICNGVNHYLYSEINADLFGKVLNFFNEQ